MRFKYQLPKAGKLPVKGQEGVSKKPSWMMNRTKPEEFFVQPRSDDTIQFSSGKTIGILRPKDKKGLILMASKELYTGVHMGLAQPPVFEGLEPGQFPDEFVQKILEACPSQGGTTEIAPGFTLINTVKVIG